ncbi:hypothetical protein BJ165DRAFT_756085 [Panaeolus papilionaceus]|nr:hypothetical protein BJ165DRAFT_756085 [Panaeolus papilionaceus]
MSSPLVVSWFPPSILIIIFSVLFVVVFVMCRAVVVVEFCSCLFVTLVMISTVIASLFSLSASVGSSGVVSSFVRSSSLNIRNSCSIFVALAGLGLLCGCLCLPWWSGVAVSVSILR